MPLPRAILLAVAAVLVLIFTSCALPQLTPQQAAMGDRVAAQPLDVVVPRAAFQAAWGKAQEWIARNVRPDGFGGLPVKSVTDYQIITEPVLQGQRLRVGFQVIRADRGDSVVITVRPMTAGENWEAGLLQAKALAHYIQTGEELPWAFGFGRVRR